MDSWQTSDVLCDDCPAIIRDYVTRLTVKGQLDQDLELYIAEHFPAEDMARRVNIVDTDNEHDNGQKDEHTQQSQSHDSNNDSNGFGVASMTTTVTQPGHAHDQLTATATTGVVAAAPTDTTPGVPTHRVHPSRKRQSHV